MVGFRVPLARFRIPKPWIPDSTDQNHLDSGFRIPDSGLSYMGRYLTAILKMLEAILQASFSEFLNEIEPGTWIPLRVFVLRDISVTDRK